jgi:hypothetical protein
MISIVNGYICTSSCDVAAAKQGKDPAAPPGSLAGTSSKKTSISDNQPATVLDGALKDFTNTDAAARTSPIQPTIVQQKVNLLA